MTLEQAVQATAQSFEQAQLYYGHGTASAWDEAVALVLAVTQASDDQASLGRVLTAIEADRIAALAERRIADREPLAYLLGEWPYLGLPFFIERGVLVPRSPIAYWLAQHSDRWIPAPPRRVLDLCTGSGCIGIVTALAYPDAQLWLTDLDPAALALAQRNVARHGLAGRTQLLQMDGVAALAAVQGFDLVLCNPPYVNARDMASLPREYQAEPAFALAAGMDGLDIMLPVLDALPGLLAPHGLFLGEVGHSAAALRRARPELPLHWLDDDGADAGLFALPGPAHAAPS
jgi:ribosomal protein L3 glutamine methyltransferase